MITFIKIFVMVLSCICSQFYILGLNRQILCRYRKKLYVFVYALDLLIQSWFTILLKIFAMLPNLNGAKFDILGRMANSAHIRKHCSPGGNNVLKRFFSE